MSGSRRRAPPVHRRTGCREGHDSPGCRRLLGGALRAVAYGCRDRHRVTCRGVRSRERDEPLGRSPSTRRCRNAEERPRPPAGWALPPGRTVRWPGPDRPAAGHWGIGRPTVPAGCQRRRSIAIQLPSRRPRRPGRRPAPTDPREETASRVKDHGVQPRTRWPPMTGINHVRANMLRDGPRKDRLVSRTIELPPTTNTSVATSRHAPAAALPFLIPGLLLVISRRAASARVGSG